LTQSVVLSGGYEDDHDEGEWFLYTGSGGRDLSGNKRTNKVGWSTLALIAQSRLHARDSSSGLCTSASAFGRRCCCQVAGIGRSLLQTLSFATPADAVSAMVAC
jgi:hypothetical protein